MTLWMEIRKRKGRPLKCRENLTNILLTKIYAHCYDLLGYHHQFSFNVNIQNTVMGYVIMVAFTMYYLEK